MEGDNGDRVGEVLSRLRAGEPGAMEALLPLVYEELRSLADARLRALGPGQTLQPTELVHEVFLRLTKGDQKAWEDKRHFIAVAALAMRSIIVDRARARLTQKRGNGKAPTAIHEGVASLEAPTEDILAVDEAVRRLEAIDPRSGRVVVLRFYLGLTEPEIAAALGVTDRTVRRDWNFARAWLQRELQGEDGRAEERPRGAPPDR